jgi:hypothetical protein
MGKAKVKTTKLSAAKNIRLQKVDTAALETRVSETKKGLEGETLTRDDLLVMAMEKVPCTHCGGLGETSRYTPEQLVTLETYGKLPICAYWREYCSKEGVVPRDVCYKERDPRNTGKCATANHCD